MNTEQAALVYATYQAHTDVAAIPGGPNPGRITYNVNNYDVTNAGQFLNYLKAKGERENPLKADPVEANRL